MGVFVNIIVINILSRKANKKTAEPPKCGSAVYVFIKCAT